MKFSEFLKARNDFYNNNDTSIILKNIQFLETKINDPRLASLNLDKFRIAKHLKSLRDIDYEISLMGDTIEGTYKKHETNALIASNKHYKNHLHKVNTGYIRDHNISFTKEINQFLIRKIELRSNWQYPALELYPLNEEWTARLVANDPLYVVGTARWILHSISQTFNKIYQTKLRLYIDEQKTVQRQNKFINFNLNTIQNHGPQYLTGAQIELDLPKNQFGYIFNCYSFNYMNLETIHEYLQLYKQLLRPGGIGLIGYSNCDNSEACVHFENGYWSYNNEKQMIGLLEANNFEIISSTNLYPYFSFIEFKMPGELHTLKTSPVVAKITKLN